MSHTNLSEEIARLAGMIDHTCLREEATAADIAKFAEEARTWGFAGICVRPHFVSLAHKLLAGSSCRVVTVIGFPSGDLSSPEKAFEVRKAFADGADEFDMVLNTTSLKDKIYGHVFSDVQAVVEAAEQKPVKVILETGSLSRDQRAIAAALAAAAGATFVKTSTGFGPGGATVEDVALLRQVVGPTVGVKASGGIKTREQALAMVAAGANRIGTSAGIAIVSGKGQAGAGY